MTHPLARALLLSFGLHLALIGGLEAGKRLELWRFSPFALLAQMLQGGKARPLPPPTATPKPKPAEPRVAQEEMPVIFVDVDPAQAANEAPPSTPYYAAVNSRAGNPDTSRQTDQPRLDGKQDKVLKTMDSERAKPSQPLPRAVPTPPVTTPLPETAKVEPRPAPEIRPVSPPKPDTLKPAVAETPAEAKVGDLAMLKPSLQPAAAVPKLTPTSADAVLAQPARQKPRTLAAAMARQDLNPLSAQTGERIKQEGGIKRFSIVASVDTKGSPVGAYDAQFIAAVQQCWYNLLENQRYSLDRSGKVVLEFRITSDGQIIEMKEVQSDVGQIYTYICQSAITKPSPYPKWPADVRKQVGADSRSITFTFYY